MCLCTQLQYTYSLWLHWKLLIWSLLNYVSNYVYNEYIVTIIIAIMLGYQTSYNANVHNGGVRGQQFLTEWCKAGATMELSLLDTGQEEISKSSSAPTVDSTVAK